MTEIDLKTKLQEIPQADKVDYDKIIEAVINALSNGIEVSRDSAIILALFQDCETTGADEHGKDYKKLISKILGQLYRLVKHYQNVNDTSENDSQKRSETYAT